MTLQRQPPVTSAQLYVQAAHHRTYDLKYGDIRSGCVTVPGYLGLDRSTVEGCYLPQGLWAETNVWYCHISDGGAL